ncbi:hypothetical protein QTP70_016121 [Hemibagrus guttatus]|uniref:MICOS complex subunit MIC19 n=1 Tax=Hemibagrus guttatus TaxID=175788 RepID=A0AAE0QP51_9TELE|nr:hypothetical protein QTP70_016121 [Hemibagrus guttatus]
MGVSNSSRHISVQSEDAEGVVFVKGIRMTDRVIDRMREPPPVQSSQSKSSTCPPPDQILTPQSETLTTTELLAQPPSYASSLVPPPLQETISPLAPLVSFKNGCSPNEDTAAPIPVVEPVVAPVLPPLTETVGPLTSQQAVVHEENLRKQIRDELQKVLQEEIKMAKLKIHKQFEEEKARTKAEAQAKAQQQVQAEVQKILEKEQLALQQTLNDAVVQERKNIQNEQLASQYYIQKLKEKDRDLAKQDSVYKEQIAKLEEKTAKLTRVTAESFKKGLEETQKRFKRYQTKPVCSELQSKILKCYLQNTGQTLTCSKIALQYVKCVNNAKQNKKVSTGG